MTAPPEIYLHALAELVDSMKAKDDLGVRQAAEKAWLSVVRATDLWLRREHQIRVDSEDRPHVLRRKYLRDFGKDEWARTFTDLSQTLHGDIFYMGEGITGAQLRSFFVDAADYVEQTTGAPELVAETLRRLPGGARYELDRE